jgi:tetratricopeptide (TPR) repeat protein
MIPESAPDWKERRLKDYQTAEDYARRAIKANPNSTWGHFYLGASLGLTAVVSPIARQVELAEEIRLALEKSLALDANNGFAYHAYGVWHRKIAEIGKMSRVFASVLYGRSLPQGSMEKSVEYLKKAIALNPTVIVSRLELANTYMAMEDFPAARTMLSSIRSLPVKFSDDAKHKQKAQELLEEVASR